MLPFRRALGAILSGAVLLATSPSASYAQAIVADVEVDLTGNIRSSLRAAREGVLFADQSQMAKWLETERDSKNRTLRDSLDKDLRPQLETAIAVALKER